MELRYTLLFACALTVGCEKPVDANDLMAKMTAANERTCACRDQACMEASERDWALALIGAHNMCVMSAMAAQGHK